MNIELNDREYKVRTIVTNQPWTIMFDVVAEVSGDREEPTLECIDYGKVKFLPSNVTNKENYQEFMCEFMKFDTLYEIFRKEDLDKVKAKVEESAIELHFDGLDDWNYELQRDSWIRD